MFSSNASKDLQTKLQALKSQAEVVTDEMVKPLLTVEAALFLDAVVLLPSFELARTPIAKRMMQEIVRFLKLTNNAEVVGALWHFDSFLVGMQDIWVQLD